MIIGKSRTNQPVESETGFDTQVTELIENGNVNLPLANIVDEEGHNRFIEGDIDSTSLPNLTLKYGKWSLSGTHLMIVLALEVPSGTTTAVINKEIKLPQWVIDKIVPVFGVYIEDKGNVYIKKENASQVGIIATNLNKQNDKIYIAYVIQTATTDTGFVRITYDLLIDSEVSE